MNGESLRGSPSNRPGDGTQPARHIPWAEIFQTHISIVEGHNKMMDMIRKHTVPNSDNWRTVCPMVERAQEMLRVTKDAARNFVPPIYGEKLAPLDSSLASMYSPANHEVGRVANVRGTGKGTPIRTEPTKSFRSDETGGVSDSSSDAHVESASVGASAFRHKTSANSKHGNQEDSNPHFVADFNPIPVDIPDITNRPIKRSSEVQSPDETSIKKSKKVKMFHNGDSVKIGIDKHVEFEDISDEVDARLKEKEEKKESKEEKKRKRQPEETSTADTEPTEVAVEVDKPKKKSKKSSKKLEDNVEGDGAIGKKRQVSKDEEKAGQGKKKKKKKKQKTNKVAEIVE